MGSIPHTCPSNESLPPLWFSLAGDPGDRISRSITFFLEDSGSCSHVPEAQPGVALGQTGKSIEWNEELTSPGTVSSSLSHLS